MTVAVDERCRVVMADVAAAAGEPTTRIAVSLHLPPAGTPLRAMLFCVPGGGVNRCYFDLAAPFSFAAAMTRAGYAVVAVDPPAVGGSSEPDDGFAITAEWTADLFHHAVAAIMVAEPTLAMVPRIGVGHSAGAMLIAVQQDRHRDFAAVMLLCFSARGLPELLDADELAAADAPDHFRTQLAALARRRFGGEPYLATPDRPGDKPANVALRQARDRVAAVIASHAMSPGNVAPELARITVPVLLAAGDADMTGPPHMMPASYPASADVTLLVVRAAGHHIFVADRASAFFTRAAAWLDMITKERT